MRLFYWFLVLSLFLPVKSWSSLTVIVHNGSLHCTGGKIFLDAQYSGTDTVESYSWVSSLAGNFNDTSSSSPYFIPSATGLYTFTCSVFLTSALTEQKSITFQVGALPQVNITGNVPGCLGQANTLTANVANGNVFSGLSYQWTNGANTGSTQVTNANTYCVSVTENQWQCAGSACLPYQTVDPPTVIFDITDSTFCQAQIIRAMVSDSVNYTYSWQYNGLGGVSASDSILIFRNGFYQVTATGRCVVSASKNYYVFDSPPPIVDFSVCPGNTVVLYRNSAEPAYEYYWRNNFSGNEQHSDTAVFSAITLPATIYLKVADSITGCEFRDTTVVNPFPLPTVEAGAPVFICNGQGVLLDATGVSANTSISWIDPLVADATEFFPVASQIAVVNATTINGCFVYDTLTITVWDLPRPNLPADTGACLHQSLELRATGGTNYQWSTGSAVANILLVADSTFYVSVTVTDLNGCSSTSAIHVVPKPLPVLTLEHGDTAVCSGLPVNLNVFGSTEIGWFSGSTFLGNANTEVTPTGNTYYGAVGYNNLGCSDTVGFWVSVNSLPGAPVFAPVNTDTFCSGLGGGVLAVLPEAGIHYSWSSEPVNYATQGSNVVGIFNLPPGPDTLQIIVDGIDTNNCHKSSYKTIYVGSRPGPAAPPVVYSSLGNSLVCLDNTMDSYQWGYDEGPDLTPVIIDRETQQEYIAENSFDPANRLYWVLCCKDGCCVKSYYNTMLNIGKNENQYFKAYPNPASTHFVFENTFGVGKWALRLSDLEGQLLLEKVVYNESRVIINTQQLAAGMYLLNVLDINGIGHNFYSTKICIVK